MNNIKAQTLKGFRDFLPAEERKRQYVISTLKRVFELYGFEPLETPALEYEAVLLGKYGDEGDKLMYRFEDNGGRKVALRYDQTVPLARVVAQYQNQFIPFKRYQIQPVWRAENPQKGRFREFLQCDIDTVGSNSPLADAEIITCAIKSLETLGFKDFNILLNDRSIFRTFIEKGLIDETELIKVLRILDKLKKIGRAAVTDELVQTGFSKERVDDILQTIENCQPSENLKNIFTALKKLGTSQEKIKFMPALARGLDYYTGLIFEIEVSGYSAGSVCGGGRYDNLIGMFAGKQIPAVGFAFGFDRLIEAMDQQGLFPKDLTTTKVLVTIFNPDLLPTSLTTLTSLRKAQINTEVWLDPNTKLEKQLKYADQKGIPYVVIIGSEEASQGKVTLKSLKTQTQEVLSLEEAIRRIQSAE